MSEVMEEDVKIGSSGQQGLRVDVIGFGSRGDVQPMAALVYGLQAAGHRARLISHTNFAPLAELHGIDFAPIRIDSREIVESDAGREWLSGGTAARPFLTRFARLLSEATHTTVHDAWTAIQADPPDVIVSNGTAIFAGASLAEKLGVPYVRADLQPTEMTRALPSTLVSPAPTWLHKIGGAGLYNLISHGWSGWTIWNGTREATNRARVEVLGLPPWARLGPIGELQRHGWPVLCAYSDAVVEKPFEWADNVHITGYWTLPASETWTPPEELTAFLESGPLPICVTFGSMLGPEPERVTSAVLAAIERIGRRAILVSGWGGLADVDLPPGVMRLDSAPFEWLFQHVSVVVHHCGAGTTGAALGAGIPSVAVPLYADQPFWARRLSELGVAPPPLLMLDLEAEPLAQAIEAALMDPSVGAAALELGQRLGAEDGVGSAIAILEELVGVSAPTQSSS